MDGNIFTVYPYGNLVIVDLAFVTKFNLHSLSHLKIEHLNLVICQVTVDVHFFFFFGSSYCFRLFMSFICLSFFCFFLGEGGCYSLILT